MIPRGRWIYYSMAGIILSLLWFILKILFPKNADMLPFFMVVIALDLYLWFSVRRFLVPRKTSVRLIVNFIYWLPVLLLISQLILLMTRPIITINIALRTYWMGIVLLFYAAKLIPILFLLIADLLRGLVFLVKFIAGRRNFSARRSKILIISGWTLGFSFFFLLLAGMLFWVHAFRVHEETIRLPELPQSFDGMRIVQISDVHLGSWTSRKKLTKAIQMVNDLKPDVLFVTGDLANFATTDVLPFRNDLAGLKAREKIFVIMGNHDYGDYTSWPSEKSKLKDRENLYRLYDSLGWIKLLNQNYILKRGNDSIAIIGVHNWGVTRRFQRLGDLARAEKGVEFMQVQLLLSHDPTHWDSIVSKAYPNIDVTFSGHTHAMQIGFTLFGKEYSPSAFMYRQWGGLYSREVTGSHPQYIYVNRGLGTIGYPGRVGELPEITLFTLKK